MNFFYGIKSSYLNSSLSIPKFKNVGIRENNLNVYEAFPNKNTWEINKVNCEENSDFFFVNEQIENNKIFFLANDNDINLFVKNKKSQLINFNNFTETIPEYRSNLKIFILDGGFSSYQSEYPFGMINKRGNILSPINILLDINSDHNIIFFKNIYFEPKIEKSNLYFINIEKKEVLEKVDIYSNYLNEIKVKKEYLKKNIYIFSENCLGIPMFVSIKDKHISFEHTHPPHHYILSEDKFKIINSIKNEYKEIINK